MVKSKILYYPNFEPDPKWLRGMLLFFDSIGRILPKDIDYTPSPQIAELLKVEPNCLEDIRPEKKFVEMDGSHLGRFENAFRMINPNPDGKKKFEITFDKKGDMSCKGHVFLHSSKYSEEIKRMLIQYKLILDIEPPGKDKGFRIVDDTASNLILSYLADRLANNYGLNTVTDKSMDYAMQLLNSLNISRSAISNGILASSIITVYVPEELFFIKADSFQEIRNEFADLRPLFYKTISEISLLNRLEKIEDAETLKSKAEEISNDFLNEYDIFQKKVLKRQFKRFSPIIVGNLISLYAATIDQKEISIGSSIASLAIQGIQEISSTPSNPKSKLFKLMTGMENEIFYRDVIDNLI